VLANTSNGDVDQQVFTIRGIYTTHTPSLDQTTVFMPLAKAQAISKTENHASVIFVLLKDKDQTDAVVAALKGNPYQVKTWVQLNDLLNQYEQLAGGYMYLLYLIVLGVTATVIVNTLIMSVFERTREIGILSAIGMKGSRIMAMFFTESCLLGIGGIAIGLVLGGLLVSYATVYGFPLPNLGFTTILLGDAIHAYMNPSDVVSITILTFIVTLLSAIYPAMLAANMEPVQALRGGK
jgi:putative ABC transport system permease protein